MGELNIKSTTIEKGLDLLKGFLDKAFGPSVEEFGLGLSDNLKLRRFKNQLLNLQRAKEIVEQQQVNVKQINLKALFPYLEGAALEEDESLQEMWANLFVNYIDTDRNLTMTVFPDLLRHLSTNEVKLLEFMVKNRGHLKGQYWHKDTQDYPEPFSPEEIGNLLRLGLIDEVGNFNMSDRDTIEELRPDDYFITDLGDAFLDACHR
jgi:hypothetical protein